MQNPLATNNRQLTSGSHGISGQIAPTHKGKKEVHAGKALSERNTNLMIKMMFVILIILASAYYLPAFISGLTAKLVQGLDGLRFNLSWLGSFVIWFVGNIGKIGIWLGFAYMMYFVTTTMYRNPEKANHYLIITLICLVIFSISIRYAQTYIIPAFSEMPYVQSKF